jgi:A/G-specific adenine glycosylase
LTDPDSFSEFRKSLLDWHQGIDRPMPWKGEKDPYKVWLSEIILQQTQVSRGSLYYERFLKRFPDVTDLASASLDEVMKMWEGLGYYSRARNLHKTAGIIVEMYGGEFPDDYDKLLSLQGVGPYTAAAIGSFAFGIPRAVVDGNVYRVLARYFGIEEPIDTTAGKKLVAACAEACLDQGNPGGYNQAIIDFGALQCRPFNPDCDTCPMQGNCLAFSHTLVDELPRKSRKLRRKVRFFHYLYACPPEGVLIRRREGQDIWKHLYEMPLIEFGEDVNWDAIDCGARELRWWGQGAVEDSGKVGPYTHLLTHQEIRTYFWFVDLSDWDGTNFGHDFLRVTRPQLKEFAFPRPIRCFFEDKALHLKLF